MLDKKAETREFYFVFPGLFHFYSRAMDIYVHFACLHSRVYHSRLTIKHLMISTTTVAVVRIVFNFSVTLVVQYDGNRSKPFM